MELLSKDFLCAYKWLIYSKQNNIEWCIENSNQIMSEAIYLRKLYFKQISNWIGRRLTIRCRKWHAYYKAYGIESKKTTKQFRKFINEIADTDIADTDNGNYHLLENFLFNDDAYWKHVENYSKKEEENREVPKHFGVQKVISKYWRDSYDDDWRSEMLSQSRSVGARTELGKNAKAEDEDETSRGDKRNNFEIVAFVESAEIQDDKDVVEDSKNEDYENIEDEKRDDENAYENPANDVGGDVDKPQVESMISKNINIDQKDKSLKKNNENLDYGLTLKNTSMVRNLEEERQLKSDGVTEQSTGSENAKKVAERTDKMMSAIFDKSNITGNYLLAGCSSKGDPSLQKEVTVNPEKLPQKIRKVNTETKMISKHYEEEEHTKNDSMYRTLYVGAKNNADNLAMRVVQASHAMLLTLLFHGPVSCSEEGHCGVCLESVTLPIGCQLVFDPGGYM